MSTLVLLFLIALFLAIMFFIFFGYSVPSYTGVILGFFGSPWKSIGPGGPYFRIPGVITFERVVPLEKVAVGFKVVLEDQAEEAIPMDIYYEYMPDPNNLINYCSFSKLQIENAVKERIRNILSIETRKYKKRDDVLDNIHELSRVAKEKFECACAGNGTPIEIYYGIKVTTIAVADPELPEELKQAAIQREVMEKTNETRGVEMEKIKQIAKSLIKAARKHDQDLRYETALELVLINLGKIKQENKLWGLNEETLAAIRELLPVIIKEVIHAK